MATHAQRPPDHGPGFVAISLCGLHVSRRKLSDAPTCKRCTAVRARGKRPRVHCPVCAQLVAVTPNGKVWRHLQDGDRASAFGVKPCRGSGQSVQP